MLKVEAGDAAVNKFDPIEPATYLLLVIKFSLLSIDDVVNLGNFLQEILNQQRTLLILDLGSYVQVHQKITRILQHFWILAEDNDVPKSVQADQLLDAVDRKVTTGVMLEQALFIVNVQKQHFEAAEPFNSDTRRV